MNEKYTWILAGGYSAAFFSLIVIFHFFPSVSDSNLQGRLADGEFIILNWAFGSSVGSRAKDNLLAEKKEEDKS